MYNVEHHDWPNLHALRTDDGRAAYTLQRHELAVELKKMNIEPDPAMGHAAMLLQLKDHRERQDRAARDRQRAIAAQERYNTANETIKAMKAAGK